MLSKVVSNLTLMCSGTPTLTMLGSSDSSASTTDTMACALRLVLKGE
jgi:hypothetical protein